MENRKFKNGRDKKRKQKIIDGQTGKVSFRADVHCSVIHVYIYIFVAWLTTEQQTRNL